MDPLSPPLIALYCILGACVVAYVYIMIMGSRLTNLSRIPSPIPEAFESHDETKQTQVESGMKPLYP